MTAVCAFVGHEEAFDANINFKMQTVVDQLAAEHETIEFLVYPNGLLSHAFLLAALRAKNQYPKKVTITFVTSCSSVDKMGDDSRAYYYFRTERSEVISAMFFGCRRLRRREKRL